MKRGFVVHWNGPPAKCVGQPHSRCIKFWDAVKSYHLSKGWSDIAYSWGICSHGLRFQGRGWFKNQFANGADVVGEDDGKDSEWYTVLAFLGEGETATPEMAAGVRAVIADGRTFGHCGNRVLPHNAFKVKTCPGPQFTALAKLWDDNPFVAIQEEDDMFGDTDRYQLSEVWKRTGGLEVNMFKVLQRLDLLDTEGIDAAALAEAIVAAGVGDAVVDALKERLG